MVAVKIGEEEPRGIARGRRSAEIGERSGRRAREVDMGANFAIVTLVLVFAVVIGISLGRKLRRK